MWQYRGQERPPFAVDPGPDQESVWDYPRPPALVRCASRVWVEHRGSRIADSSSTLRVLETASPPTYYIPALDVDWEQLVRSMHGSRCEWKGQASYWNLVGARDRQPVGWSYHDPHQEFAALDGCLSFYPARVACFVDGERVRPQEGGFYGGWITDTIAGPCKGGPGTGHW